jgi:hypothetical protein
MLRRRVVVDGVSFVSLGRPIDPLAAPRRVGAALARPAQVGEETYLDFLPDIGHAATGALQPAISEKGGNCPLTDSLSISVIGR